MATTPKTYGTTKKTGQEILDYVSHYMGGAGGNDPGMIAKGMQDYGVNLDDIYNAGQEVYGANGTSRQAIGDYIKGSGNDWLKSQYANWGSPAVTNTYAPAPSFDPNATTNGLAGNRPGIDTPLPEQPKQQTPQDWMTQFTASLKDLIPPPQAQTDWSAVSKQIADTVSANTHPREMTWEEKNGISSAYRANELMGSNSPLLQQANQRALEQANARGLLNSTGAIEAGTQAMLAEAGKYGSTDAGNYLGLLQTDRNNDAQMQRLMTSAGYDDALYSRKSADSYRDNMMGFAANTFSAGMKNQFDTEADNRDFAQQMQRDTATRAYDDYWKNIDYTRSDRIRADDRANKLTDDATARNQYVQDRDYLRSVFEGDRTYNENRTDTLALESLEQGIRGNYATAINGVVSTLQAQIQAIQMDGNLEPEDKAAHIQIAKDVARTSIQVKNLLFTSMPEWKAEWATFDFEVA
jgi:hypothetical protein